MTSADLNRRAALAGVAAATAAAFVPTVNAQTAAWRQIEIAAKPIDKFLSTATGAQFGRLTFRGGLTLTSADRDFGGLSGLAVEADGRSFIAVTDEGAWLTGAITEKDGRPRAIEDVRLGPILGSDGIAYARKRDKDCEAVAILNGTLANGTVLASFERNHRIERFPVRDRALLPSIGALAMPREASRMEGNKGLEAMTVLAGGPHKGGVIAYSERYLDTNGHHTGWLWGDGQPQRIGLTVIAGFDITDVASLPDGSLIILERRFRWTEGVKMQLRLVPAADIAPGRIASGDVLFTADNAYEIDNMEGVSAHIDADGTTVLTLVSDNNFNPVLQRTILLQFGLRL